MGPGVRRAFHRMYFPGDKLQVLMQAYQMNDVIAFNFLFL